MPSTTVPEMYMPQVQLGMHVIEGVDRGVYIDNMYRLCRFEDLARNDKLLDMPETSVAVDAPICCGYRSTPMRPIVSTSSTGMSFPPACRTVKKRWYAAGSPSTTLGLLVSM